MLIEWTRNLAKVDAVLGQKRNLVLGRFPVKGRSSTVETILDRSESLGDTSGPQPEYHAFHMEKETCPSCSPQPVCCRRNLL